MIVAPGNSPQDMFYMSKTIKKNLDLDNQIKSRCFGRGSCFPHGFRSLKAAGSQSFGSKGKHIRFVGGSEDDGGA